MKHREVKKFAYLSEPTHSHHTSNHHPELTPSNKQKVLNSFWHSFQWTLVIKGMTTICLQKTGNSTNPRGSLSHLVNNYLLPIMDQNCVRMWACSPNLVEH